MCQKYGLHQVLHHVILLLLVPILKYVCVRVYIHIDNIHVTNVLRLSFAHHNRICHIKRFLHLSIPLCILVCLILNPFCLAAIIFFFFYR